MLHGKRILAVVPARSGSKGLLNKNILSIAGVPLVAWTGKVTSSLPWLDRAVVSTDQDDIATAAKAVGLAAPFRRPKPLAEDIVADHDVLDHALRTMEELDHIRYDVILMLQPTCPLRRPSHVEAAALKLVSSDLDAVWTVSETDSKNHPLKQLTITGETLDYYDQDGAAIIARQQMRPVYHRNGAAYAITRECILYKRSIKGNNTSYVIIEEPLVSIDTFFDLDYCEFILAKYYAGRLF
ncbi:CMP-N,N'-diacetyllegionaminic acid synthase [Desulfovibrionales bacterium]